MAPVNNTATLSSYTPSLSEKLVSLLARNWYGDTREGYRQANRLMDVAGMTPIGAATEMYDAGRNAGAGNYGQAAIGAIMAAAPIPGSIKKEARQGIKAYHGSPHSFDKFDMSRIGTGEGAQAYGHGLYFAEGEGVAKAYRENVKDMGAVAKVNARLSELARIMHADEAGGYRKFKSDNGRQAAAEYDALMDQRSAISNAPGQMYEVNIDADPEQFLDWDKPLSEQSESVRNAFGPGAVNQYGKPPKTGEGAYWGANPDDPTKASKLLKEAGIPGIKYLDAGSRTVLPDPDLQRFANDLDRQITNAQNQMDALPASMKQEYQVNIDKLVNDRRAIQKKLEPTRNYVVFDDKLVSIVRKYGIAGASTMLGYDILANADPAQAAELQSLEPK